MIENLSNTVDMLQQLSVFDVFQNLQVNQIRDITIVDIQFNPAQGMPVDIAIADHQINITALVVVFLVLEPYNMTSFTCPYCRKISCSIS